MSKNKDDRPDWVKDATDEEREEAARHISDEDYE